MGTKKDMKMDFRYVRTRDGLRLMGVHYEPDNKDIAVLLVHGMSGNTIENYFGHVLGKSLAESGIGFIFSHNRGYNHINDIATSEREEQGGYKTVRIGATYELFEDSLLDSDVWLEEVKKLGYKKIILMGHSLGCNKVIYYYSQRKPQEVIGIILASPPDMLGQLKPKYEPQAQELYKEAKENVANRQPEKLLSRLVWDWYSLSSQTFLSLFTEDSSVDNLPVLRNPADWLQLASIPVPILAFMGEYDDIVIRSLAEDIALIKEKATGTPSFSPTIIPKANHVYDGEEEAMAEVVGKWIKSLG